jgi:hypothetical protein
VENTLVTEITEEMEEEESNGYYCLSCGDVLGEYEVFTYDDEDYCETCLDEETFICTNCADRFGNEDNEGDDDTPLCGRCRDYHYSSCERCGDLVHNDNIHYADDDYDTDDRYCYSCYEHYRQNVCIHNYGYKPSPIFHGQGSRFMGVELEIDKGGKEEKQAKELYGIANGNGEHIYIKHDGSLNNGFEIVTHPMTLDYHRNQMPWKSLIERALELNYLSHDTDTCGLHVHINRDCFGEDPITQEIAISKVLYFVERFWRELLLFSRRTQAQLEQWAKRYGYEESPVDILCKAKRGNGRYMCVNLENYATFEFRIFRGTLIYNTLIAALQLVDEICNIASSMTDDELIRVEWRDFTRQIDTGKYPELIDYLNEKKLYC